MLSDEAMSLLVDLPYEPGAFGYERYDPRALEPAGAVVSVIRHHHRDHFDPALFVPRGSWRIIGPPSVTAALSPDRVLEGVSVTVGAFAIIAVPTPHTEDHRSYRIRWRGRVLHFAGDTGDASTVPAEPRLDVLFVTPWLSCASNWTRGVALTRVVLNHQRRDGSDRVCGTSRGACARWSFVPHLPSLGRYKVAQDSAAARDQVGAHRARRRRPLSVRAATAQEIPGMYRQGR